MEHALLNADVLDSTERNIALGSPEEPVPGNQFAVLDAIGERKVANDSPRDGQTEENCRDPNIGVRTSPAAEDVNYDERQKDVAHRIPERKHERQRVQPAFESRRVGGNE